MPKYKQGSKWSATDANYCLDNVRKLVGYYELLPTNLEITYATMDVDIQAGETQNATNKTGGATVTVTFTGWLSQEQISAGKNIAYTTVDGVPNTIILAECETPSVSLYDEGSATIPTLGPGDTERIPLTLGAASTNPAFTIVGGNVLEAIQDVVLNYTLDNATTYVATGNNQDISITANIVTVAGTPTIINIPLADTFISPRSGDFQKTHSTPTGAVNFTAGDQVAFEFTNLASSAMDLEINGYILSWRPAG